MTTTPTKPTPIACQCGCQHKHNEDVKWFALLVRQGLKTIVVGIEKRYGLEHETQRDRKAA